MRRPAALAVAALLLAAAPAHADRLLLPQADAEDLVEQLAEARQSTGVCFGWMLEIVAYDGSPGGLDSGSDAGADQAPGAGCQRALVLEGSVTYTSESSESEDSAFLDLRAAGVPGASVGDLQRLVGRDAGDLLGDDDDKALYELVAGLPLLAAQADPAIAQRLPAVETGTAPAGAAVDDNGGNDWVREHGAIAALGLVLLCAAAYLVLTGIAGRRRSTSTRSP